MGFAGISAFAKSMGQLLVLVPAICVVPFPIVYILAVRPRSEWI
jgi:hypothetical protein